MFIVTLENNGQVFYLRGTVWSFSADRAHKYESLGRAQEALNKARPFTKPALWKRAQCIESAGV